MRVVMPPPAPAPLQAAQPPARQLQQPPLSLLRWRGHPALAAPAAAGRRRGLGALSPLRPPAPRPPPACLRCPWPPAGPAAVLRQAGRASAGPMRCQRRQRLTWEHRRRRLACRRPRLPPRAPLLLPALLRLEAAALHRGPAHHQPLRRWGAPQRPCSLGRSSTRGGSRCGLGCLPLAWGGAAAPFRRFTSAWIPIVWRSGGGVAAKAAEHGVSMDAFAQRPGRCTPCRACSAVI